MTDGRIAADPTRQRGSVVCGVDQSDQAPVVAETATVLAQRLGLRLAFVHAVPATVPPLAPVWPHHAPDERGVFRRRAIDAGWRLVEGFVTAAGRTDVIGRVESGLAAECLRAVADEETAEYIVIGTRGEGAARAALMGSTMLATMQTASCPVVVVPPEGAGLATVLPQAASVVCGVGSDADEQPLVVAAALAAAFDLSLLPAHIIESPDAADGDDPGSGADELLADLLVGGLATARSAEPTAAVRVADAVLRAVEDPAIRAGDPAEQLAQLAAEARAACVVVGTHGRGALRSAVLGSASRSLARRSAVPVVICPRG